MPFAEGQSLSPRVTPQLLHPASMDAADAYGVIIDGQPGPTWFNYQVQLCVTPKGTWIACWTQGGYESNPDQRVVVARSLDDGRTWGREIVIEPPGGGYRVRAWIVSYAVPHTGRVYVFYWYNINGVPLRDAGDIFFKYSDDDGLTWSSRFRVGVPRTAMDDALGDIHGWNFGQPRLLPTGQVMMAYAKIRRSSLYPKGWRLDARNQWQPEPGTDPATKPANEQGGSPNGWCTEVFFIEFSNILTETDPGKLKFRFLPEGARGSGHPIRRRTAISVRKARWWDSPASGCCASSARGWGIHSTVSAPTAAPRGASPRCCGCALAANRSTSRARRAR